MTKKIDTKSAKKSTIKIAKAPKKPGIAKAKPPIAVYADFAAVLKAKKAGRLPNGFEVVHDNGRVFGRCKTVAVTFNVDYVSLINAALKALGIKASDGCYRAR